MTMLSPLHINHGINSTNVKIPWSSTNSIWPLPLNKDHIIQWIHFAISTIAIALFDSAHSALIHTPPRIIWVYTISELPKQSYDHTNYTYRWTPKTTMHHRIIHKHQILAVQSTTSSTSNDEHQRSMGTQHPDAASHRNHQFSQ
ncbi:hypothetical protein ACTA71_003943 [Dictyostelium dimigraforme]